MDMEFLAGILVILCSGTFILLILLGIPFGFLAYQRRLRHRELMSMLEKNMLAAPLEVGNGKDTLRWGIVITALGLAFCIGLYPLGFVLGMSFPLFFGPWMLIGLIPTFFGLALIVIYLLTDRRHPKPEVQNEDPQVNAGADDLA